MKNPEGKILKIVDRFRQRSQVSDDTYAVVLSNLAIAESNLVKAGKDSALPHFIAIVKELERLCEFEFKIAE